MYKSYEIMIIYTLADKIHYYNVAGITMIIWYCGHIFCVLVYWD